MQNFVFNPNGENMPNINLDKLSLTELKKLHQDVEGAIKSFEERNLLKAREELETRAKELGVTLDMVAGVKSRQKKKTPAKPKFRHPENPDLTWAGRGRKPTWFVEAIEGGLSEDDMKI